MLQQVPVEVGQQVGPGTNLARVADQSHLKAQLKIAETQAKDIMIGQSAVDRHAQRHHPGPGVAHRPGGAERHGHRGRGARGRAAEGRAARPERGRHDRARTARTTSSTSGRPTYGQEQSVISLFKLDADGVNCTRVKVTLGKTSVNTVEVKAGLKAGDQVILSDMSQYDAFDRIRLK